MKAIKKGIVIVGISILLMINISPTYAQWNKKETLPQLNLRVNENIVANISVTWDSFFHRFSLKDLDPTVIINQSIEKDFYFPEINGTIQSMNFTVVCKHKLNHSVLFPRFTRVYIALYYNNTIILLNESNPNRCKSKEWNYINLTVESVGNFSLVTHGENVNLTVEVGAYFFIWGAIEKLDPITVHPIPSLP